MQAGDVVTKMTRGKANHICDELLHGEGQADVVAQVSEEVTRPHKVCHVKSTLTELQVPAQSAGNSIVAELRRVFGCPHGDVELTTELVLPKAIDGVLDLIEQAQPLRVRVGEFTIV